MYLADILSDLTDRKLIEWKDVIQAPKDGPNPYHVFKTLIGGFAIKISRI